MNSYELIKTKATEKLKSFYGDFPNQRIVDRLEKELEEFKRINQLDNVLELDKKINSLKDKGVLLLPRLSTGNSLLLYLLGISNVSPLPKHNYCPKCHSFNWGKKHSDNCDCCGNPLIEDGYDLDYEILIDTLEKTKCRYAFSSSNNKKEENSYSVFYPNQTLKLAKELGLKQEDLEKELSDIKELICVTNEDYFANNYKKKSIVIHQPFIGLRNLDSMFLRDIIEDCKVHDFDGLVKAVLLMHGTNVLDSNERFLIGDNRHIEDYICSKDEIYKFLKERQLDNNDALLICKETRLCGKGHLSDLSIYKLKEAGIDEDHINFFKCIDYIFYKAHVVAELRVLLQLANIWLYKPKEYYDAFFSINKEILPKIDKNTDLLKELVNSKSGEQEDMYLAYIDMLERL